MSLGVRPLGIFFLFFAILQFGVYSTVYEKGKKTSNEKSAHAKRVSCFINEYRPQVGFPCTLNGIVIPLLIWSTLGH